MTTTSRGPGSRWPDPETESTTTHLDGHDVQKPPEAPRGHHGGHGGHGGHGLMMMICCIPMILIAVLLVATGVAGSGALLWALGCVAMMAVMMFAMGGGHQHK